MLAAQQQFLHDLATFAHLSPIIFIPKKLLDHILQGEYVEFDDLLPEDLGNHSPDLVELVPTEDGLTVRPPVGRRQKRHVDNLTSWL